MPSLSTSETPSGGGGACSNNMLDKFIQLVLATIVAAFIFLLGLLIIDVSGKIYTLLNPTQTQSQKVLKAVQSVMSWVLTLIVAISGYVLLLVGVGIVFVSAIVFLIRLITKAEKATAELKTAPAAPAAAAVKK